MSSENTYIYANARFKPRSDTRENWETNNPVLLAGEHGVVTNPQNSYEIEKIGDGVKAWNTLPWWKGPQGTQGPKGDKGDTGAGVPEGGTAGQVLKKKNGTDYDTEWGNLSASDVGAYSKPSGGIPKTDLSSGVQEILDNAGGKVTVIGKTIIFN